MKMNMGKVLSVLIGKTVCARQDQWWWCARAMKHARDRGDGGSAKRERASFFDALPDEMLVYVATFVASPGDRMPFVLVCRRFRAAAWTAFDPMPSFQHACEKGYADVVKRLLLLADARVDPAAVDNRAIRWSSENGHADVVQLLLADARVDPVTRNNYAIRWSIRNGHCDVVRLLLEDGRADRRCGAR